MQTRASFLFGASRRATGYLQLVHMDLYGRMSEETLGGNMYFYVIVDDLSKWCGVFFQEQV